MKSEQCRVKMQIYCMKNYEINVLCVHNRTAAVSKTNTFEIVRFTGTGLVAVSAVVCFIGMFFALNNFMGYRR